MGNLFLPFTLFMLFVHYPTTDNVTTPAASLQEHMKKIDEMLAKIQSHAQAQEQKNSAVLSSVLSQLTQTIQELEEMKTSQNETILKKDAELSELWTSHNSTVSELHELHAKHNNVVMEFEETKSKLENLQLQPFVNGNIGFHARVSDADTVYANKTIIFDKILYNTGAKVDEETEAYDKSKGIFSVPMNGTYLLWFDLTYRRPENKVAFLMQTNNDFLEKAYGGKKDPHGQHITHETAATIGMHYLQQGEEVWVAPTQDVVLASLFCNFGAVLLNAH